MHVLDDLKNFYTQISQLVAEKCLRERNLFARYRQFEPTTELKYRHAGVMLLFLIDDYNNDYNNKLVFIERTKNSGIHSGQIAFPGGSYDKYKDNNYFSTAIRETYEEIGVIVPNNNLLYNLTPVYVPVSCYLIHPYLAYVDESVNFRANREEVEKIYTLSLSQLLTAENTIDSFVTPRGLIDAPCYKVNGIKIWGATAIILTELLCLEKNRLKQKNHQ